MCLVATALDRFHGKVYILLPISPERSLWKFKKTGNGAELEASETVSSPPTNPPNTHTQPLLL